MQGPAGLWLPSMAWVSMGCCWHPQAGSAPMSPPLPPRCCPCRGWVGLAPGAGMGDRWNRPVLGGSCGPVWRGPAQHTSQGHPGPPQLSPGQRGRQLVPLDPTRIPAGCGRLPGSLGALMGYPRGTPGCWPPKPPSPAKPTADAHLEPARRLPPDLAERGACGTLGPRPRLGKPLRHLLVWGGCCGDGET